MEQFKENRFDEILYAIRLDCYFNKNFSDFYLKEFQLFEICQDPESLQYEIFIYYANFCESNEDNNVDFGEFLNDFVGIYCDLVDKCKLMVNVEKDLERKKVYEKLYNDYNDCICTIQTEMNRFQAYTSKELTFVNKIDTRNNSKDIKFSIPEIIYFLTKINFMELEFFKNKDEVFKKRILQLITRGDWADTQKYYNSLDPESKESGKVITHDHKNKVNKFIKDNLE